MILLVMISQTLVYREVTALFNIPGRPSVTGRGASVSEAEDDDEDEGKGARRREELWSKTLSW